MTRQIRYFLFLTLIALAVSCKKKTPEDIGLPILPGEDLLNASFTDTITLITHTVYDDSLKTDEVTPLLLGNMNDPVFGVSKASIFTQISLSKSNPVFGINPQLDSVVLSLVYSSGQYYGALDPQKFKVYEVSQSLYRDSIYYSNRMLQFSTELGSAYVKPKPNSAKDSVMVDTIKYPPHLRIHLDKNFFQNFLTSPTYTASYTGNAAFQKVFKGLYISSSSGLPSGQGAIMYMDLVHTYSRVTMFYHNKTDTTSLHFVISNSACARFTHFEHDYSFATEIKSQVNSADSIQKDVVFVQPMAGVRTKVTMPYLKDLYNNGKIVINKAELIMPVDPSSIILMDSIYVPHPKLVATIADSALGPLIMPDYFEGATYFGGDYDAAKKEYRFNIARYVQQILNGKKVNQGLYIIANARPTTANRAQLVGGRKNLTNRMRLKITYTPLY